MPRAVDWDSMKSAKGCTKMYQQNINSLTNLMSRKGLLLVDVKACGAHSLALASFPVIKLKPHDFDSNSLKDTTMME